MPLFVSSPLPPSWSCSYAKGQARTQGTNRQLSSSPIEQVTSWQEAKLAHERFVTDYNAQPHWAHRKRDDNRLSPAEVLGQENSKLRIPEQLHRIFYATRFLRRLNRLGYVYIPLLEEL